MATSFELVDLSSSPSNRDLKQPAYEPPFELTGALQARYDAETRSELSADQSLVEESITPSITFLSRPGSSGINGSSIQYHLTMPEYPETSQEGVVHIIPTENFSSDKIKGLLTEIQYSKSRCNARPIQESFFFGNASCEVKSYKCNGVKYCQFTHPEIKQTTHSKLDDNWSDTIIRLRSELGSTDLSPSEQASEELFQYHLRQYNQPGACQPEELCFINRKLILRQVTLGNNNAHTFRVSCANSRPKDGCRHYHRNLSHNSIVNTQYLANLFATGSSPVVRYCTTIESHSTNRTLCTEAHIGSPIGGALLSSHGCDTRFQLVIPKNQRAIPFVALRVIGIHSHAPPPPRKLPNILAEELYSLINQGDLLNMTTATFLSSPEFKNFLQSRGASFAYELHGSLNNRDKWSGIIQKQRFLNYPFGRDILAVLNLYSIQHSPDFTEDIFLQKVISTEDDLVILVIDKSQASLLLDQSYFQVDMTFSRIYGKITEIVVAIYFEPARRSLALARLYVNQDTAHIYQLAFKTLFESLHQLTGRPVLWQHIHSQGFYGIVVDMCRKQASGFGRYLNSINPTITWQDHLRYTLIFCLIHFERNIKKSFSDSVHAPEMRSLPHLRTKREVQAVIDRLLISSNQKVGDWARNKNQGWILGGLCRPYSLMDPQGFENIQRNSNNVESIHFKTQRVGIQLTLLGAIMRGRQIDKAEFIACEQYLKLGIPPKSKTMSFHTRIQNAEKSRERRTGHLYPMPNQSLSNNQSVDDLFKTPTKRGRSTSSIQVGIDSTLERRKQVAEIEAQELLNRERQLELKERELKFYQVRQKLSLQEQLNDDQLETNTKSPDIPSLEEIFNSTQEKGKGKLVEDQSHSSPSHSGLNSEDESLRPQQLITNQFSTKRSFQKANSVISISSGTDSSNTQEDAQVNLLFTSLKKEFPDHEDIQSQLDEDQLTSSLIETNKDKQVLVEDQLATNSVLETKKELLVPNQSSLELTKTNIQTKSKRQPQKTQRLIESEQQKRVYRARK